MFNNKKKFFAFTLTELLVALTIIGAIAALTIPSVVSGVHKKLLITSLKNTVGEIQLLANNQLTVKKTKSLLDTDFADPAKLLREKNFPIVQDCKANTTQCWTQQYKTINGAVSTRYASGRRTVKLKNGAILSYDLLTGPALNTDKDDKVIGIFRIDVNGDSKPNIIGRDVFWFEITKKGKIIDDVRGQNGVYNEANAIAGCKSEGFITGCYAVVVENNWVSPY